VADLTIDRAAERRETGLGPHPSERQSADRSPSSAGVELRRLTALARLTAPQAVELGASLLAEAAGRPGPDAGAAGSDRVVVGADGRVLLGPDGAPAPSVPALVAVLADVARAARSRSRRADPAAERLLAEFDLAATELPTPGGLTTAARRLGEAAAAIDRDAARAGLAALVRAVGGGASSGGTAASGPPSTGGRTAPARRTPGRGTGATRRVVGWALSVLALASVVVVEVVVLRDDIAADVAVLLDAGRSGAEPSAATEADGVPIEPPAPASAGSVAAVDLRRTADCAPGGPCALRLLVRLVPGAGQEQVTWSYRVVDRCTGATETLPGGSVTVPAGGERATVVGSVPLPDLPAVAVVAVTDRPAGAASAPVSFGSCPPDSGSR
jgi:hypothetical protein